MVTHDHDIAAHTQRTIHLRDGQLEKVEHNGRAPAAGGKGSGRHERSENSARLSWQSIARNKTRSLLTMLGIIIGVASVIIMIAISAGTEADDRRPDHRPGSEPGLRQPAASSRGGPGTRPAAAAGWCTTMPSPSPMRSTGVVGVTVEQESTETVKADAG